MSPPQTDQRHPVERQIERADRAIVAEDFDTLMGIYREDAILVIQPGRIAVGRPAIRKAFESIARHFQHGLQVEQRGMEILESGDTSLVLARTVISAPDAATAERQATYVFRRDQDGQWRCAIDNSYGHDILPPAA